MKYRFAVVVLFLVALCANVCAEPFVHPLFTDHAVLQRDRQIPVWGWTTTGRTVTVSISGVSSLQAGAVTSATSVADSTGRWQVYLGPFPVGGPCSLQIGDGVQSVTRTNVMLGDVWLCSGQSNMEFTFSSSEGSSTEPTDFPNIRLFQVDKVLALDPRNSPNALWNVCKSSTVQGFSAVGFYFGRNLHTNLNVPIGLINSSWGGTRIQAWMDRWVLRTIPAYVGDADTAESIATRMRVPGYSHEAEVENWWIKVDPGSTTSGTHYSSMSLDTTGWLTKSGMPAQLPQDGYVWLRKELTIPVGMAAQNLRLKLGQMIGFETAYFNGIKLGFSENVFWSRDYQVPASAVQAGRAVVALRIYSANGSGGAGFRPGADLRVELESSSAQYVSLAGDWLYKFITPLAGDAYPVPADENTASSMFNGMIAPVLPSGMKGTIWYQGEWNAGEGLAYNQLLPTMIYDWRCRFGMGTTPFLTVQLASDGTPPVTPPTGLPGWAMVREAQQRTAELTPASGVALCLDTYGLHPLDKTRVGNRLAWVARATVYGQNIEDEGPRTSSVARVGSALRVTFNHVGSGLTTTNGAAPAQFAIAGSNMVFSWATATILPPNVVELSSASVPDPLHVRYAFSDYAQVNLTGSSGLPAHPFRTDTSTFPPTPYDTFSTTGVYVATLTDDAEEYSEGTVSVGSGDLEMTYEAATTPPRPCNQTVGIRFQNAPIPPGSTISAAWIQFTAIVTGAAPTTLTVQGENTDYSQTFVGVRSNISARPRTAASVSWVPSAWTSNYEAGVAQRTPDLKTIVQEIVNRGGWVSNNPLTFIVTGTGVRNACAMENNYGYSRAVLHVQLNGSGTNAPTLVEQLPLSGTWKYADHGVDLGTAWRETVFADTNWPVGPAGFGYGGAGSPASNASATILYYGGVSTNKYITTYFRRPLVLSDLVLLSPTIQFSAQVDDGAIVYLNGSPVWYHNMTNSGYDYQTLALTQKGAGETDIHTFTLPSSSFVVGTNVIAAELHQGGPGSSDVLFNLWAQGLTRDIAPPVLVQQGSLPYGTNPVVVPPYVPWVAYNDFNLQAGELNTRITSHWAGNAGAGGGALIDFASGTSLAARIDMSVADTAVAGYGFQQALMGGTEAADIFTNKVSTEGYMNWSNQYPLTLTISRLNPSKKFKVVLFANRTSSSTRFMHTTISSVDSFTNQSTAGSSISTVAMANDRTELCASNLEGRVVVYSNIQPGSDSNIVFTIQAAGVYSCILNAMRVEELADDSGADGDVDGMSDTWEQQYFGGTTTTNGGMLEDFDNDGSCNYDEYRAGTDPTSAGSKLEFTQQPQPTNLTGQIVLTWPGVAGKSYGLLNTTNPAAAWTTLRSGIAGVSPTTVATVNVANAKSFWRIKVE